MVKPQIGQSVFISTIGSVIKCSITAVQESSICCVTEHGKEHMVYSWEYKLDDAVSKFLRGLNVKFGSEYILTEKTKEVAQ